MKLLAILRIKDQIATIDGCLSKLSSIADEIILIDNGSTDGTLEKYKAYPKIVKIMYTEGYDEGRDKIMLLEEAKLREPGWILWIDADEVFEDHFTREVAEGYMRSGYNRITFRMCNFWLDTKHCRFDGQYYLYNLHPQRSMWKNVPSAYFRNKKLHNGDIFGVPGKSFLSPYRLKHYGYVDRRKMQEKLDRYLAEDKSGDRDYIKFIDPNLPNRTYVWREFKNKKLNYAYILMYKYICNLLWLIERLRLKIFK
ncbi:MAG: glycosyl transferase family 2 [Parcubacteria group bacterium]|nr:glycosyl transferase family 2 [Parcubacteria group bacterium]